MLCINLLPEGARKATLSPVEQFHRTPLLWIIASSLIGFVLACLLPISVRRQQLQRLNAKIHVLQPQKATLDQLQRELQHLRGQEAAFQGLSKTASFWSRRLNTLSDTTPDDVWFTELSLDESKGLVIEGAAGGDSGTEMGQVGRLVGDLKADPDFASAFKNIQIESIKRAPEKDIELVRFTITCVFTQGSTP